MIRNQAILIKADLHFIATNGDDFKPVVLEHMHDLIRKLQKSFLEVCETFNRAKGPGDQLKRGLWAFRLKNELQKLTQHMEKWHQMFTDLISTLNFTGWGVRVSISSPPDRASDIERRQQGSSSALFSNAGSALMSGALPIRDLSASGAEFRRVSYMLYAAEGSLPEQNFMVEQYHYETNDNITRIKDRIEHVVGILSKMDPLTTHILSCQGYIHQEEQRQFQLKLLRPPNMGSPRTLRDVLQDKSLGPPSINAKLELCQHIARSMLYTHTEGLVHKSIRPEDIVLLQSHQPTPSPPDSKPPPRRIGMPFLTGFSLSRESSKMKDSSMTVSADWRRDLYNHPTRHGSDRASMKYTMAHDIYSIGVILLEIGVWQSFIIYPPGKEYQCDVNPSVFRRENAIKDRISESKQGAGTDLMALYKKVAKLKLPAAMGKRFTRIVGVCLDAVENRKREREEDEFSDGEERHEEQMLGVGFINTVLSGLEEILV